MKSQPVNIFFPIFPKNSCVCFSGYVEKDQHVISIYITKLYDKLSLRTSAIESNKKERENQIRIHGHCFETMLAKTQSFKNYMILDLKFHKVNLLIIDGIEISAENSIVLLYDHYKIKESQTPIDFTPFTKLKRLIYEEQNEKQCKECDLNNVKVPWLSNSMFLQHIYVYYQLIQWLIISAKTNKKVTIKQGNLILAIIADVILGCILLQLLLGDIHSISSLLMGMLERLINSLYSLLKWLMGAPVGLKLNNAFNKMLGKYFSYHVQLWWLFLDVSGEKLDLILQVYRYVGYLGLTFQIAVISDMICIATFHSYCIYVYAARLLNMQISGLIALLRLFVGRKYNPLRGSIDSCEYTNQELFVGTVAFTILLLLLPTTALYYIVFTLFRILSLALQYILAQLIYIIQTFPFYVISLWVLKSPKVAGNVLIERVNGRNSPLVVEVQLLSKSLTDLVAMFRPPVEKPKNLEIGRAHV